MDFPELVKGKLIKRYKRFLADIELENGSIITAHCPNSGRMTQCQSKNWPVLLSYHNSPKRRLKYTWELVHNGTCWICINTHRANEIAYEALINGKIPDLNGYEKIERERKYGKSSRIDLLLSKQNECCYVEVKSVTLLNDDGYYCFPDAPTERGRKHLDELIEMKKQGHRAVMLFIIMRSDGKGFKPATHIDPEYATKLNTAADFGVEIIHKTCSISTKSVNIL